MKFYLTAAIPYVNARPHIGHALEFLQGDVIARYHRGQGDDTFYISGADENSLKVVRAADSAGVPVAEYADQNAEQFLELMKAYNIELDWFQRSSDPKHYAVAQDMWRRAETRGDIYKKQYTGLYCVGCEAFYDSKELNEAGQCPHHPGKAIEEVTEENYFFRLSKYQDELVELIESDKYLIRPQGRKNEALAFIKQGLQDFSISRSKERARGWGVPVPGDDSQIMYVWFDALNVYRSAAPDRWPANLHIIGKDILRFHAVYWPAMLLSAELSLPKELFVHGFITVDGAKMSKSVGNTVDPLALVEEYGTDAVRYYLLREIPSDSDGDFSEDKFKLRYNADLANGVGNYTSRVLTLAEKLPGLLPAPEEEPARLIAAAREAVFAKIEERKFHEALAELWRLVSYGDGYINEHKPWELKDEDSQKILVLSNCLYVLAGVGELLEIFLPETAGRIAKRLKRNKKGAITSASKSSKPLFARLG
ncbi:MAG: methionine--tRNA ligase [Candidatus Harrisonbacteria bacterium CG10_big_fil_rev_8_21_14_0_10_49_15]|uniref:Methionine--tRNA ligase n=1 Tax=Candidatus Harrisonbacteria bacterium CG10_big_fil_rev_8_21_14_0_10_49_15 TaxID=1974587 RepID=A0A2H0UL31_9BACT|nr:MAG: methionine--tRNA ligase [Candidatus Harrisonbacteria bacterium CG10_big_fil_rev_8_21_14_0_10_49_15]